MRWLCCTLIFIPGLIFAKQLTLTIIPTYPLNIINTQLICASLHANLTTEALSKLDTFQGMPVTCKFDDSGGVKKIMLTLSLAD